MYKCISLPAPIDEKIMENAAPLNPKNGANAGQNSDETSNGSIYTNSVVYDVLVLHN